MKTVDNLGQAGYPMTEKNLVISKRGTTRLQLIAVEYQTQGFCEAPLNGSGRKQASAWFIHSTPKRDRDLRWGPAKNRYKCRVSHSKAVRKSCMWILPFSVGRMNNLNHKFTSLPCPQEFLPFYSALRPSVSNACVSNVDQRWEKARGILSCRKPIKTQIDKIMHTF